MKFLKTKVRLDIIHPSNISFRFAAELILDTREIAVNSPNRSDYRVSMSDSNTANAPSKTSSGTASTSKGGRRRREDAVGDLIAARLTTLIEDSIQRVVSVKEQVQPLIRDIKGQSDEITEQLHQSRQQALVRKNKLEAERQEIHQAACQVIKEHNQDTANDS